MRKLIVNEKQNGKKLNIVLQSEFPRAFFWAIL